MAKVLIFAGLVGACGQPAIAQVVVPGMNAPPLASLPSPPLKVPQIPQAGASSQPNLAPPQNTFPDRVGTCI
jgi:hypothetical protein